jgi:hypothetical protein
VTDVETFWFDLAPIARVLAMWFRFSSAMFEAVVATIARLNPGAALGAGVIGAKRDPRILKPKRKDVASIGSVGFLVSFFHRAAAGEYPLESGTMLGWLAGVDPGQLR